MDESVLRRIKKLMELGSSPNESEAKAAMQKVSELLILHNISASDVKAQAEYTEEEFGGAATLPIQDQFITSLLKEYFFVEVIESTRRDFDYKWRKAKFTIIIGKSLNVQIAKYVYDYLMSLYPAMYKDFKKALRKEGKQVVSEARAKKSYYYGLNEGISKNLQETKWRIEQERGLVLVRDQDLVDHVAERTNGKVQRQKKLEISPVIAGAGEADGAKVRISKALESNRTESGKALSYGGRK